MANGADGSVIIDTSLDNSGVDMGAKEVEKRVNALVSAINKFGANIQKSAKGFASNIGEILSREYANSFEGLGQKLKDLGEAEIPTQRYKTVTEEIAKTEAALERLEQREEKMRALGADQSSPAWQKVQAEIEETTAKLDEYKARLQEAKEDFAFMNSQEQRNAALSEGPEGWGYYTQELDRLRQYIAETEPEITKLEDRLAALLDRQAQLKESGADLGSKQWQSLQYDIDQTREKLEALLEQRDALEQSGGDFKLGSETEEYQNLVAEYERLQAAMNNATPNASGFISVMMALARALASVAQAASNAAKKIARMGFNLVASGVKKAINNLKSFTSQTKKTTLATNGLVKSLTSLKRMLITRVKRMFISYIFNSVRDGLQKIAQYSTEFGAIMAQLKGSASLAAGNIAVALSNLVTAVAPLLLYLINILSTVVSYLNQFFSLLGGKSTYTAAKQDVDAFAKSVGGAAGAQKKLNAELYSYDELTRQSDNSGGGGGGGSGVTFEELPIDLPEGVKDWVERLKEAWQSGDWYGVGKVIAEGLNAAMEVVDNWINNKFRPWAVKWAGRLAEILNGFMAGLNWKLLGKTIADGINAVFDAANTFLKKVNWLLLGRHIGDAIKSWFDNIDWKLIGETFARKWNALIQTIRGIVTTPGMWESIGKSIGEFIKSWFTTIDINSIAGALIGILNGITASIRAFLDENPFEGVAEKIYNAINRVLHEVDWAGLGQALSDLFKALLNVIHEVVKNVDWHQVGVAIGEFLGSIDWAGIFMEVADIIWTALKGVIEGLFSTSGGRIFLLLFAAIKGLGLVFTLGKGLLVVKALEMLAGIFAPVTAGLTTTLPAIIAGAGTAITGAITGLGVVAAAAGVGALGYMGVKMLQAHQEQTDAFENEIHTAFDSYVKLYNERGGEVAAQWAQMCYGIEATGEDWEADMRMLAQRLSELTGTSADDIYNYFMQNADKITGVVEGAGSEIEASVEGNMQGIEATTGAALDSMGQKVDDHLNGVKTTADTTMGEIGQTMQAGWDNTAQATAEKTAQMEADVTGKLSSIAQKADETVADIGQNMPTGWDTTAQTTAQTTAAMETDVHTKMDSIANKTDSTMASIGESVPAGFDGITQNVALATSAMELDITTRMDAIATKISESMTAIGEGFQVSWDGVTLSVTTAMTAIETDVTTRMTAMTTAITTSLTTVGTGVTTTLTTIKTGVTATLTTVSTNLTTKMTAMKTAIQQALNTIKTNVNTSMRSMSSTVKTNVQQTTNTFVQKWKSVVSPVNAALQSMVNGVRAKMTSMKQITMSTIDQIKGMPWYTIGQAIVDGIGQGVNGRWPWLESLVQQRAMQLLAEAKAALGIASPSKVFEHEIGENIGLGWAKGIEGTKNNVLNTVSNISDAITDEASDVKINANADADVTLNGMQTVVNGLSGIATTFKVIAETLSSIGSLPVPQIAEGTVVPYQTKVAANSTPAADEEDAVSGYLTNILSELQSLVETVRTASNGESVIKVLIDGREVFNTVVTENNRAIRRTGASPIRV